MTADLDASDIDDIKSTDIAVGGVDNITTGIGNDILIGGLSGDILTAGDGHNLIFGDHGRIRSPDEQWLCTRTHR